MEDCASKLLHKNLCSKRMIVREDLEPRKVWGSRKKDGDKIGSKGMSCNNKLVHHKQLDPRTSQTMLISLVGFQQNPSSKMFAKFE
jgi:hypothetical protein